VMKLLLQEIRKCTVCAEHLPLGPRPIVAGSTKSKIIIIGQAPGRSAHNGQKPWDDVSGKRLRNWLGVDDDTFYDPDNFGMLPMGFCYPGKGKTGDLPPRKECAPLWHQRFLEACPDAELILLIGAYSQKYYLNKSMKKNLTETVLNYNDYLPKFFPIPHPSPLNQRWLKRNSWFDTDVLPVLKAEVKRLIFSK